MLLWLGNIPKNKETVYGLRKADEDNIIQPHPKCLNCTQHMKFHLMNEVWLCLDHRKRDILRMYLKIAKQKKKVLSLSMERIQQ